MSRKLSSAAFQIFKTSRDACYLLENFPNIKKTWHYHNTWKHENLRQKNLVWVRGGNIWAVLSSYCRIIVYAIQHHYVRKLWTLHANVVIKRCMNFDCEVLYYFAFDVINNLLRENCIQYERQRNTLCWAVCTQIWATLVWHYNSFSCRHKVLNTKRTWYIHRKLMTKETKEPKEAWIFEPCQL